MVEFPVLVAPNKLEWLRWKTAAKTSAIKVLRPAGLTNPKFAELVINMTEARDKFRARLYRLNGTIQNDIRGDGVDERIKTALASPMWCWYYESQPNERGVIVAVLLHAGVFHQGQILPPHRIASRGRFLN
jgi:hypothetical protein